MPDYKYSTVGHKGIRNQAKHVGKHSKGPVCVRIAGNSVDGNKQLVHFCQGVNLVFLPALHRAKYIN